MFKMTGEDVFAIRNRGVVATGRVESGTLRVGDTVQINGALSVTVDAIEKFRKQLEEATTGEDFGVLMRGIDRDHLNRGDVLTGSGEAPPIESTNIIV